MQASDHGLFDRCLYFNLVTLTRGIGKIWQHEFARLGLSPSHGYLLFAIVEEPQASQQDLARVMELDASTITRFIDALAARGLVAKTSRGKGAVFAATAAGKREYRRIARTMDALYESMQQRFGEPAFATFVGRLLRARHVLREEAP